MQQEVWVLRMVPMTGIFLMEVYFSGQKGRQNLFLSFTFLDTAKEGGG